MEEINKRQVVVVAVEYMQRHGISQAKLSQLSGVNEAYLSNMLNGIFEYKDSRTGEMKPIKDSWFVQLSEYVEGKQTAWRTVVTTQFAKIIAELNDAREFRTNRMLIGMSGCGKSYAVDKFRAKHPVDCVVITCHHEYRNTDLSQELAEKLVGTAFGSPKKDLDAVTAELWKRYRNGQKPIIVIDECENLTNRALLSLKALYDYLMGCCSIVLIGTDQLIAAVDKMALRNVRGIPQFKSRFKSGIRYLDGVDILFKSFFDDFQVTDNALKEALRKHCSDYRNLKDYLEPMIKESQKRGEQPSYGLFMEMFGLKK